MVVVVLVAAVVFILRCCAVVFLFSVVAGAFSSLFVSVWSRYGRAIVFDDVVRHICQKSSLRQETTLFALHR